MNTSGIDPLHVCYRCHCFPCRCATWEYKCEHCYCLSEGNMGTTNPHRTCCKCGNRMAEKFIKGI